MDKVLIVIFQRWITAADTLGPFWSGFASYSISQLAETLEICRASHLAEQLRQRGPSAVCGLDPDERDRLAADVEPTLGAGFKSLLQNEAVSMERSLGTIAPLRIVVFGKSAGHDVVDPVMRREFPNQRGLALFLQRPTAKHLRTFENWRHQILWPEPVPPLRSHRLAEVKRLPAVRCPDAFPNFLDLESLARLRLPGQCHASSNSRSFLPLNPGDPLRVGALTLLASDCAAPSDTSEILLGSAYHFQNMCSPVIFSSMQPSSGELRGTTHFVLGSPRDVYGRVDFDPLKRTHNVSVLLTRKQRIISQSGFEVRTDQMIHRRLLTLREGATSIIEEAIVLDLPEEMRTEERKTSARQQAEYTVNTALAYAARYLEWLEWHPETSPLERQMELKKLEHAMFQDITPELRSVRPALLKRDLFRSFEEFLRQWGLQE